MPEEQGGSLVECVASQPEATCHVLVVESSPELRRFMVLLLEEASYPATAAATPREALRLLAETSFDLVITDTFGQSAQDALASVAGIIQLAGETPVVLCTGYRFSLEELRRAGVRQLIEKPFEVDAFVAQVQTLCEPAAAVA